MGESSVDEPGKPPGRTPRGGRTRERLLQGTLLLLAERGYGATTVQAVLDHTGLSRGSLLHQFATRDRLMLAAAEAALERMLGSVERALSEFDDPIERLRGYPKVLWAIQQQVPARAFLEILVAARWEAGLEPGLGRALRAWNRRIAGRLREFAAAHGIGDPEPLLTEVSVLTAAMQGLALTSDLLRDEGAARCVLEAVSRRYLQAVARAAGA